MTHEEGKEAMPITEALKIWDALDITSERELAIKNRVWNSMGTAATGALKSVHEYGSSPGFAFASIEAAFVNELEASLDEAERPRGVIESVTILSLVRAEEDRIDAEREALTTCYCECPGPGCVVPGCPWSQ